MPALNRSLARVLILVLLACATWMLFSVSQASRPASAQGSAKPATTTTAGQDNHTRAAAFAAWDQVYSVLISPRCINCHTATNYPQQGEDRHRHQFNVVRGPDGRGVPGLTCAACHQGASSKAAGGANCAECHQGADLDPTGVPGGHDWHLAPLSMAWQDRNDKPLSSAQVCRSVTDRTRNMNMGGPELLKHHQEEELVLYAWRPGRRADGTPRALPPLTHAQFVEATRRWVEAGTPCPPQR